ncbi:hypothetical protein [Thermoflexus sp.]|uniref:hypothetical protein n=1 Tax=Thermoflexus sp. TaxID=1969742 RepID=UPI0035E40E61
MAQELSPYALYAARAFIDALKGRLKLGLIVRKPLAASLEKLGFSFKELTREEAQKRLNEIVQVKGATITHADLIKHVALALVAPSALLTAFQKKLVYTSGVDTGDSVVLEFLIDIPRLFRPSLSYYLWLSIPYSPEGAEKLTTIFRTIKRSADRAPLTPQEWADLSAVRAELAQTGIRGMDEDLWHRL